MLLRLRIENLVLIQEAALELGPGLNALTGETGAGKTIFSNAIGLLLGARGDAGLIGPAGEEAYVEAEFDAVDDARLGTLVELRPAGEDGLVLARRIFADGRTRAYAWGRAAAREDVAAAADELIAMSGQFEQRRLARPAYQLEVLDAFAGLGALRRASRDTWRELMAARKRHEELTRDAEAVRTRVEELRALAADTEGLEADYEQELRVDRERLRHASELLEGTAAAAAALAPDDGVGATELVATAAGHLAPVAALAPELAAAAETLADAEVRLREAASDLRGYLASLDLDPGRLEQVEESLERLSDLRRRHRVETYAELLEGGERARSELAAFDASGDPESAAAAALAAAEAETRRIHDEMRCARREAAGSFADAVAAELAGMGLGDGEFRVELDEREAGPTGADTAVFLVKPNPGLPFGPVAETASGGELSRVALAIAAVGGGETMVFDEIDAGVGGTTAHAVAETLRRLAAKAQVITITHLPQIASAADAHFRVQKLQGDPTRTEIAPLDDAERREELERMLGGAEFLSGLRD